MANDLDDLFDALASINAEVVSLGQRVEALETRGKGPTASDAGQGDGEEVPPGSPVDWETLSPEEDAVLWPEFVNFVIWLADRYEMTAQQLPRKCWYLHGGVVDELTALWTAHQSAYAPGEDAGSAPYLWQDAVARMIDRSGRYWLGECKTGKHTARHRVMFAGDESYRLEIIRSRSSTDPDTADE